MRYARTHSHVYATSDSQYSHSWFTLHTYDKNDFDLKLIQRRDDFGEPRENFNRDWGDYKNGFGDPAKEFWLGNENIYMLTNNEDYILRVELEDFEGNKRYTHKL